MKERLQFSVQKFVTAAFLSVSIHLSKILPILVEVVFSRWKQGAETSGDTLKRLKARPIFDVYLFINK